MRKLFCSPVQQWDLLEAVLEKAGVIRLTVTGPSMAPTIFSGDALEVRPHAGRFAIGEIYFFRTESGRFYAHRLLSRASEALVFKGDGLTLADEPVAEIAVLGQVTAVWRQSLAGAPRVSLSFSGAHSLLAFYHRLRPWLGIARRRLFAAG